MKFNKWTLGLAAVGVVSLASAVKAEEKASSVMTALSSTTLSGYVDTSAQWNFHSPNDTPNGNLPPYKFGSGKADGFNLNVVQLRIEKPLDEAEWAAGYRVDLWAGPDANTLGTQSTGTGADFAIRQAYVALRMPVGNGIDWKVGVFDSIIGYESVEGPSNPNYTRSYGHSIEPQTHTGILASYRFNDMISASVGMANTIASPVGGTIAPTINGRAPSETYKTYMGSIALTAPSDWGSFAGSSLYGGIVGGYAGVPAGSGNLTSWYAGATVATPITGLKCGVAFDYADVHDSPNYEWAVAGYVSYQATEKLSLHGRAEYARGEPTSFVTPYGTLPTSTWVYDLTATVQYDLWKNVLSRVEIRYDHADNPDFGGAAGPGSGRHNSWLLAANIIYKF